jgi:hypothetical protein
VTSGVPFNAMLVRATACALTAVFVGAAIATGSPTDGQATCAGQSSASFPGAYTSARNLVVGPLVLIEGRVYSSPRIVRRVGGQKYPAVLAPGHTVKIALSPRARRTNALTYADSLHSARRLDDGLRIVTFHACERRNAQSDAGGRAVTFWSGFILASAPRCLHLKIWIDGASSPRRARIPIGRHC